MKTLYDRIVEDADKGLRWGEIVQVIGYKTPFEAVICVWDAGDGEWIGVITFKDTRFSPIIEPYEMGFQLQYISVTSASGALAHSRAQTKYSQLVSVFKGLLGLPTVSEL